MKREKTGWARQYFLARWASLKQRFVKNLEKQILESKEKPQKVALGCALGIGVNFFPTLGLGFLLAFFLATLLRINRAIATAISLLTAPLVPFMYALNFVSGSLVLAEATGKENLIEFILSQYALILRLGNIQEQLVSFFELLGSTFLMGASINAILFGTALYFFATYLLHKQGARKPGDSLN